jgi:leader peptidase (prepilin peptidase) / N-methyltransferase
MLGSNMLARWSTFVSRTLTTTPTSGEIAILAAWASSIAASLILFPNMHGIIGGGLGVLMIAIAIVDSRRFPDELSAAALALGFLHAAIQRSDMIVEALTNAALRGAVLAFAFLSLRVLYRQVRGREGIGLGDVKLAGVAGVWLDWPIIPVAIEIAALAALTVYAMRLLYRQVSSLDHQAAVRPVLCACDLGWLAVGIDAFSNSFRVIVAINWPGGRELDLLATRGGQVGRSRQVCMDLELGSLWGKQKWGKL